MSSSESPAKSMTLAGIPLEPRELLQWLFRVAMFAAVLWIKSSFVSQVEFTAWKEQAEARRAIMVEGLNNIQNTLTRIDEKMKNDVRQDAALQDHENRLRELEKKMYGK